LKMRFSAALVALAAAVVVFAVDIPVTVGDGGSVCHFLHCRRRTLLTIHGSSPSTPPV
jgi:hypothetical protein